MASENSSFSPIHYDHELSNGKGGLVPEWSFYETMKVSFCLKYLKIVGGDHAFTELYIFLFFPRCCFPNKQTQFLYTFLCPCSISAIRSYGEQCSLLLCLCFYQRKILGLIKEISILSSLFSQTWTSNKCLHLFIMYNCEVSQQSSRDLSFGLISGGGLLRGLQVSSHYFNYNNKNIMQKYRKQSRGYSLCSSLL